MNIVKYCFFILLIGIFSCKQENKNTPKPNILLIFPDDLGYGDLGVFGHPNIKTPILDKLANTGIKMTSFYAAASVCTPSRAGLLTGKYPLRAGMPGNIGPETLGGLPLNEVTLANSLQSVGYRCHAIGKWHLGSVTGYFPTDRGFDTYYGLLYSNDMMPPWVNTDRPLRLYQDDQPVDEYPVDQSTLTRRYTDKALQIIHDKNEDPFFIYLPYSMPHLPISTSEDFAGTSAGGKYGDVIEEIDFNVGRLIRALQESNKMENTIVIFTSDNGPWRNLPPRMINTDPVEPWHSGSTGPLFGAKNTSMEGGYRVPAIVYWPSRIKESMVISEVASALDLHKTLLDIAGVEINYQLDGQTLLPLWDGQNYQANDYFYFHGKKIEGIRSGDWKFRLAPKADNWKSPELATGEEPIEIQLYNLKNDPYEQFNMAKENPELVTDMYAKMEKKALDLKAIIAVLPE